MQAKPPTASAIGDLLDRVLGRKGLKRGFRAIEEARSAWIEAAGTEIVGHTRVRTLRNGVLTVDVDSPPLCHELSSFHKIALLLKVKERLKKAEVSELRFRLGAFAGE